MPAPPREYDGYRFYVTVEGGPLSASVEVNDMNPHGRSEFFHGLADDWRGWVAEKSYKSLEGHLRISATSDPLGHVSFRVVLRDASWGAEVTLYLEAGQLETIAKQAELFFGKGLW